MGYNILGLTTFSTFVVGFVFQIIALATPDWLVITGSGVSTTEGMWQTCEQGQSCTNLGFDCAGNFGDNTCDLIQANRGFSVLYLIAMLVAIGLVTVDTFFKEEGKYQLVGRFAVAFGFVAAVFGLLSFGTGTKYFNPNDIVNPSLTTSYGYSMALSGASFFLALAGTVIFVKPGCITHIGDGPNSADPKH